MSHDRDAKRKRFAQLQTNTPRLAPRRGLWIGAVALLALVAVISGAILLGGRPQAVAGPVAGVAAATNAPVTTGVTLAPTPLREAAPAAATQNHDPYPEAVAENGVIRLEAATLADGTARHYTYMAEGGPIEFFALRAADGTIRTAFNACDVCFSAKLGYTQDGDVMVCGNCGRRFPASQVGLVHGGCNPSPLSSQLAGGLVTISVEDLANGARLF